MRVALTGGSTGIGAAVATKLMDSGHEVVAFDITQPKGDISQWIEVNLADPISITKAIESAEGPFDVLLNNAGLPPRDGLTATILKVNFIGFRQFLEGMLEKLSPNAAIVNTASRAGAMWRDNIEQVRAFMALTKQEEVDAFIEANGIDHVRAYNLSKEAMIAYTISQTEQMIARGMRMNCVSPAAVSTGILDDFTSAFGEKVAKNIARVGRPCLPQEVADLILFLASEQSAWLKGADITIDGGMSALAQADQLDL